MTEKELRERVEVCHAHGYGRYRVTISYRGKYYECFSNNTLAWDDLGSEHRVWYKTDKACLQAFYNECKRINRLGEYNDVYKF